MVTVQYSATPQTLNAVLKKIGLKINSQTKRAIAKGMKNTARGTKEAMDARISSPATAHSTGNLSLTGQIKGYDFGKRYEISYGAPYASNLDTGEPLDTFVSQALVDWAEYVNKGVYAYYTQHIGEPIKVYGQGGKSNPGIHFSDEGARWANSHIVQELDKSLDVELNKSG